MSLKTRSLSFLSLSLGIACLTGAAIAQDTTPASPAPGKVENVLRGDRAKRSERASGFRHNKRGPREGLRGLNLTDAQKAQIKSIREANKPDQATLTEMKAIHEARKAGTEPTAEQKARAKAFREQTLSRAKAVHEQILAILTPEQRTQIETQRKEMRDRFQNRPERRKARPARPAIDNPKTN